MKKIIVGIVSIVMVCSSACLYSASANKNASDAHMICVAKAVKFCQMQSYPCRSTPDEYCTSHQDILS